MSIVNCQVDDRLCCVLDDVDGQLSFVSYYFFFFQAEDGIRDKLVTGVQTCALPIWARGRPPRGRRRPPGRRPGGRPRRRARGSRPPRTPACRRRTPARRPPGRTATRQIGRASCRERV